MVRRKPPIPTLIAVTALTAMSVFATGCSPGGENPAEAAEPESAADTELASVIRQDVVETEKTNAEVGFGTSITLPIEAEGLVTWALPIGSVLTSGDVVVKVSGRPVVLVVGESPLYRPLRLVGRFEVDEARTRLGQQSGPDVAQLQNYLLDLGFDDKGRLKADGVFGLSTQRAVKTWQTFFGHPATGVVDSSQLVFMTSEVLLRTELTVGQEFAPIDVTGSDTVLTVRGSTSLRDFFEVGGTVQVNTEPPTTGTVTRSTRVSGGDDGVRQLIEISIEGADPDDLGQTVEVVGSLTRASDVLTIPVRALIAKTDGTWRVEVDSGAGDGVGVDRVSVELVDVHGTTAVVDGLSEGDQVVIPL